MTEEIIYSPNLSTLTIRNCGFRVRCDAQWGNMQATGDRRQRFCSDCLRTVVLCETDMELVAAIQRNDCVAIPSHDRGADLASPLALSIGEPAHFERAF